MKLIIIINYKNQVIAYTYYDRSCLLDLIVKEEQDEKMVGHDRYINPWFVVSLWRYK
ncbi:hypothetical protein GCM10009001_17400 [Virgibacillus siamensis]|uniref:Uncharacterized protein n=1 Tax=Virgibacillus siamensis TaxID=480071 RepID=A0ABN1FZQ8_9BACI